MNLERITGDLRRMRPLDFVRAYAHKALAKIKDFDVLEVNYLEPTSLNPSFARPPADVVCRPLTKDEIIAHAKLPEFGWDDEFLAVVFSKGDLCYGAFIEDELAGTGWYSTRPTAIDDRLVVRFDPRDVYVYKGYTLAAHRGRRLAGFRLSAALRHFVERGHRGIVDYVSATNYASLHSVHRVGFRTFGRVYVTSFRGRPVLYATRGCADRGFSIELVETP